VTRKYRRALQMRQAGWRPAGADRRRPRQRDSNCGRRASERRELQPWSCRCSAGPAVPAVRSPSARR